MQQLIFASGNRHKAEEIEAALPSGFRIIIMKEAGITEDIPEPFDTLEENSKHNADFLYNRLLQDCFAEDTGLEVYALDLKPGVFSARFAGPERDDEANKKKLLQLLEGITDRRARFRTVIALYENGKVTYFEGILEGEISLEPIGNSGFGYDAIFKPNESQLTLGEMEESQKNKISHRKQALSKLVKYLSDSFEN